MKKTIEELLECEYWIIDILPYQVPADSDGQYFTVENYFLTSQRRQISQKHLDLILKLNCYRDIALGEDEQINPSPSYLANIIDKLHLNVRIGNSLLVSDPDDTYMTLYNPTKELLKLVKKLALAEGMFLWQPASQNNE